MIKAFSITHKKEITKKEQTQEQEQIKDYYDKQIAKFGNDLRSVGWYSKLTQEMLLLRYLKSPHCSTSGNAPLSHRARIT